MYLDSEALHQVLPLRLFKSQAFESFNATVAQLVEQLICNQSVGGSSPLGGSNNSNVF